MVVPLQSVSEKTKQKNAKLTLVFKAEKGRRILPEF